MKVWYMMAAVTTTTVDILERIGSYLHTTRDAVTFSSLCVATASMRWRGAVVVTPRWVDRLPKSWPAALRIESLVFKRHGVYDVSKYPAAASLKTLKFCWCRVPLPKLIAVTSHLPHLQHLHVHCLDPIYPGTVPADLEALFTIPTLDVLDITLGVPEMWPLVCVAPSRLSRSMHTFRLNRAEHIWVDDDDWPLTLDHLKLQTTKAILIDTVPVHVKILILESPDLGLDEHELLGDGACTLLESIDIRTRHAFGLVWTRHTPHLRKLRIVCDTVIIIDDSLALAKKIEHVYLESFGLFCAATTQFSHEARDALQKIPQFELRVNGGKRIDLSRVVL